MKEGDFSTALFDSAINPTNHSQITILSKLFGCSFDEIHSIVISSDGTFEDVVHIMDAKYRL